MGKYDDTNEQLSVYRTHIEALRKIRDELKVRHAKTEVWPQIVKAFQIIHDGKPAMINDNGEAVEIEEKT